MVCQESIFCHILMLYLQYMSLLATPRRADTNALQTVGGQLFHFSEFLNTRTSFADVFQILNDLFIFRSRGGSSRRAAGLQPSLKNARQKIPPNSPLILDLVAKISQHNHFRYFRHHFWLNVSYESNKTNVSLLSKDAAYAMTFSAHLPMNLAILGLSSAQP